MRCLAVLSLASALIPPTRHLSHKTCRAAPDELVATDDDGWTVTLSGLKYQDLVEGTGATASSGKVAVVQYEGTLAESGRVFDSTKGKGAFKFVVGEGSVIPAWDEGVSTMKAGGKRKLPELTMIFAYRPLEPGRTLVQPIYLAPKGSGLFGGLKARFKCHATRRAFFALRDEDGQIYENIRFHPGTLLPIDAPVARFISRVNQLEPSKWSRTTPAVESAPCELTARAGETGVSGEAHATPDCVRGY